MKKLVSLLFASTLLLGCASNNYHEDVYESIYDKYSEKVSEQAKSLSEELKNYVSSDNPDTNSITKKYNELMQSLAFTTTEGKTDMIDIWNINQDENKEYDICNQWTDKLEEKYYDGAELLEKTYNELVNN